MQNSDFKKLIEKGWSLSKISSHYGYSRTWISYKFKSLFGENYRNYKKRLKPEEKKEATVMYALKDANNVIELAKASTSSFVDVLKRLFAICNKKKLSINVKVVGSGIEGVWINKKRILFREYALKGKTSDEKKGYYRFRAPIGKDYDYLVVALIRGDEINYFIFSREAINSKKSISLSLCIKRKSKYSIYRNNWNLIFSGRNGTGL